MKMFLSRSIVPLLLLVALAHPAKAQDSFVLTSPAFQNGGSLPDDLKCERHGGDGASPPLVWGAVPAGTTSLALIMHHYPNGRVEGHDVPSHYWLLWNIPADTKELPRGNPASIGTEGSDKDKRRTGYTPPCSPLGYLESLWRFFGSAPSPGSKHKYTITLYALNAPLDMLPPQDLIEIDWAAMTKALEGRIVKSTSISFLN